MKKLIGSLFLATVCFLSNPTPVLATEIQNEFTEVIDVSAYDGMPIKVTVRGGVLEGVYGVQDGQVNTSYPLVYDFNQIYTDAHMVPVSTTNQLGFKILDDDSDYDIHIETGTEENPFDFTDYSMSNGNIISISQRNSGTNPTFSTIHLEQGQSYLLKGKVQEFEIVGPSGNTLYKNSIHSEEYGTRSHDSIATILSPEISGTYTIRNISGKSTTSTLNIDIYQVQHTGDQSGVTLDRLSPLQSVKKAFASQSTDSANSLYISNSRESTGAEFNLASAEIETYQFLPSEAADERYTQDLYSTKSINRLPIFSSTELNETLYGEDENKFVLITFSYGIQSLFNERLDIRVSSTSYRSSIGSSYKEQVKDTNSKYRTMSQIGDPVDAFRGNFIDQRTLLSYGGSNPLQFTIYYDSLANDSQSLASGYVHNFETYVIEQDEQVDVYLDPSKRIRFVKSGDQYVTEHPSKHLLSLTKSTTGFVLGSRHEEYVFDSDGRILTHTNEADVETTYHYVGTHLDMVTNSKGQSLSFAYDADRLQSVTDHAGRQVSFTYDSLDNLSQILLSGGHSYEMTYLNVPSGSEPDYKLYELKLDGTRIVRNEYNAIGAVSRQLDGTGNITLFSYDETSEEGLIITTMTEADGGRTTIAHDLEGHVMFTVDKDGNRTSYEYDDAGRKVQETDPKGHITRYTYNELDLVKDITFADGTTQSFLYNAKGDLTEHIEEDGLRSTQDYINGRLVSSTDVAGMTTSYTYDEDGNVIEVSTGDRVNRFHYDDAGYLIEVIDETDVRTLFENDELGRVVRVLLPEGEITYTYDDSGNMSSSTDLQGNTTTYEYDAFGNKTKEIDHVANETLFTHDTNGNLIKESMGDRSISYQYDSVNRLIAAYYEGYDRTKKIFTYTKQGLLSKETDESGISKSYLYDENGNLIKEQMGLTSMSYVYDQRDRIVATVDGEGNRSTYLRNALGQVIKETSASGSEVNYTYDAAGNLTSFTNGRGYETRFEYDNHNNLVKVIDAMGQVETFTYDKKGRLLTETNAAGEKTTHEYDSQGNLLSLKNALDELVVSYTYDVSGNVVKVTDGNGHEVSFDHDARGNVLAIYDGKGTRIESFEYNLFDESVKAVDALGGEEAWQYTKAGLPSAYIDRLGHQTSYEFSADGRLKRSTNALGTSHSQSFTTSGRLAEVQIRRSIDETRYTYNMNNQVTEERNPLGLVTRYGYDVDGQIIEKVNARNQKIRYEYDANGNITKKVTPEGVVTYEYDALDRLIRSGSTHETITYAYDAIGRVVNKTHNGKSIGYTYDLRGDMTEMTYPNGDVVTYTYDVMGNMLSVTDWNGSVTRYAYDENNRLIKTTHANGVIEDRTYDAAGRLASIQNAASGTILMHHVFVYDANGNILSEEDLVTGEVNQYVYDALGRLTQANADTYAYDLYGNLTSYQIQRDDSVESMSFLYGRDNEMTRVGDVATSMDRDGNLLRYSLNGKTLLATYDSENRMLSYDGMSFAYDHEGNRSSTTASQVTTEFVVDSISSQYSQLLSETTGDQTTTYVYGNGLIGSYDNSETFTTHHYDYRGSTVLTTGVDGVVTGEATYDVYGQVRESTIDSRFLFNGRFGVESDASGLYYMRARYYNPELKRFMNRDVVPGSIADSQTLNRYAYTNGNPVSFIDPFGLAREHAQPTHWGHYFLDAIGLIPLLGELADAINMVWYLLEGNYKDSALSATAIVPFVGNATTVGKHAVKVTKRNLLPNEGLIGRYKDLTGREWVGDNLTPHHMFSKEYLVRNLKWSPNKAKNEGLAMLIPQYKKGGIHRRTKTYGRNMTNIEKEIYYNLSPRDALAFDLKDLRNLYKQDGLYKEIRGNLRDYIREAKEYYGEILEK